MKSIFTWRPLNLSIYMFLDKRSFKRWLNTKMAKISLMMLRAPSDDQIDDGDEGKISKESIFFRSQPKMGISVSHVCVYWMLKHVEQNWITENIE